MNGGATYRSGCSQEHSNLEKKKFIFKLNQEHPHIKKKKKIICLTFKQKKKKKKKPKKN